MKAAVLIAPGKFNIEERDQSPSQKKMRCCIKVEELVHLHTLETGLFSGAMRLPLCRLCPAMMLRGASKRLGFEGCRRNWFPGQRVALDFGRALRESVITAVLESRIYA
jgi:hypothetical protein